MDRTGALRRRHPDGELGNAGAAAGGRPHSGDAPGPHHRRTARHDAPRKRSCAAPRSNRRMRANRRIDPAAAAVPQPDRSVRRALHRFAAFPHRHQSRRAWSRQTAVINIMALGMTMIIISGGIDLSVGAILALGGLLGTMAHGDAACHRRGRADRRARRALLCGLLNGLMITRLRIAPFIVTLGTLGIFRGLALIISNGLPVHEIPPALLVSGRRQSAGRAVRAVDAGGLRGADARHARTHAPGPLRVRHRQQSGSAPFTPAFRSKFHTTAVYAIGGMLTGLGGNDRSLAPDDRPTHRRPRLRTAGHRRGGDRRRQPARRRRQRDRHADRRVHHGTARERQRSSGNQSLLAAGDHRRGDHPGRILRRTTKEKDDSLVPCLWNLPLKSTRETGRPSRIALDPSGPRPRGWLRLSSPSALPRPVHSSRTAAKNHTNTPCHRTNYKKPSTTPTPETGSTSPARSTASQFSWPSSPSD